MELNVLTNAIRNKYRFPSTAGGLTIEQLWDLPLQSTRPGRPDLDSVAKAVNAELKAQTEDSFVNRGANPLKAELQEKLDIVVYIIGVKQAENAAAANASRVRAERARLTEILHMRTQDDLMKKTPAEIEAMLAALPDA